MAKFVGSDGSALDKLPPDLMMDSDTICSMDQNLASLARLTRNAAGGAASQATTRASTRATTPKTSTATTAAEERCVATASERNPISRSSNNSSNNSSSSSVLSGGGGASGQHGVQQQQQHTPSEEERSERACTGESLLDDGDAPDDFLENFRDFGWDSGAGAALDAGGGHDGDGDGDDEQGGGEGRSGESGVEASGVKRRKKDVGKGVGEDASDADKQRASRDRNREHARNTRIRKKQYLESLKRGVGEMLQEKARDERDARIEASKIAADRVAQRQMVLNMFYLKAAEELSPHAWACVLDDDFACVSPIAPFRSFLPAEAREDHRLISGVDGMIQDTASFAVFIQSICPPSQNPTRRKLKYQFYTSPEDTVVGPNELMCQWLMRTDNAAECGAQCEVFSHGMLRARFSADNRIHRLELIFDAMGFMQQLQRATGGGVFRTIPNTLEAAMKPSQQAALVCSVEPPYCIANVNAAWTALMGHSLEDVKFFPSSLMNGPPEANNSGELEAFLHTCLGSSPKRAGMGDVRVMTKDMRHLVVSIQAYPLGTPEEGMTHMLLIMEEVAVRAPLPLPQTASGMAGLELFPFV